MKVLIIEDKLERIDVLRAIYLSHEVSVAENFEEAQYTLKSNTYDIVNLDYDLHDTNTESLTHLISSSTLVVIHSENPDGVERLRSHLTGAIAVPFHLFTEKSPEMSKLKAMMATWVDSLDDVRNLFLSLGK